MADEYFDYNLGDLNDQPEWDVIGYSPLDLPVADYSNEGRNYPTTESTQGAGGSPVNATTFDSSAIGQIGSYIGRLLQGQGSTADYGTAIAGLLGLYEQMNKDRSPKMWEGKVTKTPYTAPTTTPQFTAAVQQRPYGERMMGMNPQTYSEPVSAAAGGLMGLAQGGSTPAPRYLRGETDGMADELDTSIDDVQPAKLSHGEFVIPADVVSHLGNGNSDAGAKQLYKMMDRVRQARTGTKKQGKEIDPEKFTLGGIAGYAGGGAVAFQTGGTTGTATTAAGGSLTGGLSPWVGDYVAGPQGYMSKAWGLSEKPYEAYQGPLTAGVSPLQQQAFQSVSNLGVPSQFGAATSLAEKAGQSAQGMGYTPSTFGTAPITATSVTSGYQAPDVFKAGDIGSGFQAPSAYQSGTFTTGYTPGEFSTGLGAVGSVQSYMNPYFQNVVDVQAREARRQADISRNAEQSRLAQAGAYGGSRQAIMEAERQRSLGQQIGDIQEKGLQSAYDRALAQRMQEAQLGLQAQQYGEQARQFGTTTGLQAQQMGEQSRQFGAQQGLSAAQLAAQFGLDAQKAMELSRQFGYGQQMSAAQLMAQYGLDAQRANQLANMQAQQSNQQAAMEAQRMAEQSKQFGANLGIQGLNQQLAAAQALGGLGTQQFGTQLQGLQALLGAGAVQRGAEQEAVEAGIRQWQEAQKYPYEQLKFAQSMIQGLPVSTSTTAPTTSMFSDLIGGIGGLLGLYKQLGGATG